MTAKTMDCDLVVIGAGGVGSICAAKAADLLPGKKIIVLEKAKKPGGATTLGHGPKITDSTWQRNAGAKPMEPQDISGQFFDFLVSKGEAEAKKYFVVGDKIIPYPQKLGIDMPKRVDKYKDLDDASIGPGWWGTYIVDKMMECCKKADIPVLTEVRAKKLIKDSNGKVTAVVADTRDGELQVNFKACFIAAGGFGADYKKCQEVWPKLFNNIAMHNLNPPTLTGDWIEFAKEAGAVVDLNNVMPNVQGPIHHPYNYTLVSMARSNVMQLQVNLEGKRVAQPGGRFGQPVDDSFVYSIATPEVLEKAAEIAAEFTSETHEHDLAKDHWKEAVEEEVATDEKWGWGHHTTKADTLAELAIKLNIDPLVFLDTVQQYNKQVKSGDIAAGKGGPGSTNQFFQGSAAPLPIENGPFYAIFGHRFKQCTHGGIVVNENHEVLDAQGNTIPGLYAGGDCTTEYTPAGEQSQDNGPLAAGPGLFGNYKGTPGGGMQGICKGITAAARIAAYLRKA
jgi:succinate dehydrogenase/fumarate reductase flavoprotein subunit